MVTERNNGANVLPISDIQFTSNIPPSTQQATTAFNTIPSSLSVNENIPLSQLTNSTLTSVLNKSVTHTNQSAASLNTTPFTPDTIHGLVALYHHHQVSYVMEQYCQPVSHSYKNPNDVCNYNNRNCIVLKAKILGKGRQIKDKSPTVFGSIPWGSSNNQYDLIDTRVVKCLNPTCKNQTTKVPKTFHYGCYMHMMATKKNDMPVHLSSVNDKDKLLDFIDSSVDVASIHKNLLNNSTNLIYPVCGKRCFNKVENHQNKVNKKVESEYATASSWERDGDDKTESSIQVLINWLTTEENCSKYFGGIDVNGRTSANRKEAYHHHIRDLIRNENGE